MKALFKVLLSLVFALMSGLIAVVVTALMLPNLVGSYTAEGKAVMAPQIVLVSEDINIQGAFLRNLFQCDDSKKSTEFCISAGYRAATPTDDITTKKINNSSHFEISKYESKYSTNSEIIQKLEYIGFAGGGRKSIFNIKNKRVSVVSDTVTPGLFIFPETNSLTKLLLIGFCIGLFFLMYVLLIKAAARIAMFFAKIIKP